MTRGTRGVIALRGRETLLLPHNTRVQRAHQDSHPFDGPAFDQYTAEQVHDVMGRASEAAEVTTDPLARRAVQLLVKRDLVRIAFDGLVSFLEMTPLKDACPLLLQLQDAYHAISDDWRLLLEDQEASWRQDLANMQEELRHVEQEMQRQEDVVRKHDADREAALAEQQRLLGRVKLLEETLLQVDDERMSLAAKVSTGGAGSAKKEQHPASHAAPKARERGAGLHCITSGPLCSTRGLVDASQASPGARPRSPAPREAAAATAATTPTSANGYSAKARVSGGAWGPAPPSPSGSGGQQSQHSQQSQQQDKGIPLEQLRKIIHELYESKLRSDQLARQGRRPRETLEEHMYTYYNSKLGVRSIIMDQIKRVLKAIDRHSGQDLGVSLFGKILANEVEEEFHYELEQLEKEVREQLRGLLRQQHPEKTREAIQKDLEIRISGEIREEEARALLGNLQDGAERDMVLARLEAHQEARVVQKPRKQYSDPVEYIRPDSLRYEDFIRFLLSTHTLLHEQAIKPVVAAFREVDTVSAADAAARPASFADGSPVAALPPQERNGYLNPAQFAEFCRSLSEDVSDDEVARLMDVLDPHQTRKITFSTCIYELAQDLVAGMAA